jgi:hypothetical protein
MSTPALNQVYKHGILALEQSLLTQDASAAATTLHVSGLYMTAAPFVVGQTYIIMDGSFAAGANGLPNAERIIVLSVAGLTATPLADGIGYTVAGTLTVEGFSAAGAWSGGLVNSYTTANGAAVLTPGMEMAIQSADFNCRFKTPTDAPKIDFDDEASRYATGDEGRDLAIAGARSGEISFTQKIAWAGAVTTVPTWAKALQAMGHLVKKYTSVGIGFLPHTWANEITATVWILMPENGAAPSTTVYRYRGAHGGNGCSLGSGKIGDVYMLTGKLSAAYVGTMEVPVSKARALTSPDTNVPEVFLNNSVTVPAVYGHAVSPLAHTYASVAALVTGEALATGTRFYTSDGTDTTDGALATAKGSALKVGDAFTVASSSTCTYVAGTKNVEISQFSLDFGGVVGPFIDQSTSTGNAYFATQDRDPKFTCNPYHVRKSLDDIDITVTNQLTGPVTVKSAATSPHITIEVPNAQLLSPAIASREGYVNTNRTYRALRNNTGAGAAESTIPDQVMYEILIGARA